MCVIIPAAAASLCALGPQPHRTCERNRIFFCARCKQLVASAAYDLIFIPKHKVVFKSPQKDNRRRLHTAKENKPFHGSSGLFYSTMHFSLYP